MSLGRAMAKGAVWMVLLRLLNRGIGLISTIILARLLLPSDFGLVAMATALVAMMELLGALGLETVLVQKHSIDQEHLDTSWTLNAAISMVQAIILAAAALPMANFYGEPRLAPICWALAIGVAITGFKNIGIVYFQRDLRFHLDFLLMGLTKLASFTITVSLAFIFRSYWALVAGILVSRIAGTLLSYVLHPYRPRLSLMGWRDLFGMSKWLYLNNFLYFIGQRAPDFVLGKLGGPRQVGLFSISYEIGMLPTTEMVAPINRAVFPAYARMASDRSVLREGYLSVVAMVALLSLPAAVGIAATSDVLVPLMLGPRWTNAIPMVELLAIVGALASLQTNVGSVYIALGRPEYISALTTVRILILLPLLLLLSARGGAHGAAIAYIITTVAMFPLNTFLVFRKLQVAWGSFLSRVWRPALATAVMYCVARIIVLHTIGGGSPGSFASLLPAALAAVFGGAATYLALIVLLWVLSGRPGGAEAEVLKLVGEKLHRYGWPARLRRISSLLHS